MSTSSRCWIKDAKRALAGNGKNPFEFTLMEGPLAASHGVGALNWRTCEFRTLQPHQYHDMLLGDVGDLDLINWIKVDRYDEDPEPNLMMHPFLMWDMSVPDQTGALLQGARCLVSFGTLNPDQRLRFSLAERDGTGMKSRYFTSTLQELANGDVDTTKGRRSFFE